MERRIAEMAAGRFRRPVVVLGIDGAYVPTRPESARGRRPGQGRHRAKRARWKGQWRDAKGFRFYLMDGDRIIHLLSWHQIQTEAELGKALKQVKDAGLIPFDQVRLCVVCDGASWIWKHVQLLFPHARQVLDYYHLRCGKVDIKTFSCLRARASCNYVILGTQGGGPWIASSCGHAMARRFVRPSSWANSSIWRRPVRS